MKTTTQSHGVQYEFDNGYTMTVVKMQGLLPTDNDIYECNIAGHGQSLVLVHQTKERIEQLKTMFESDDIDTIDEFLKFYTEDYCSPDDDYFSDDCPDYLEESRKRVPRLQKEVQEIQAELDKQLRLLGDTAIPSMIISVTRQGSGCNEDVFDTTITSISLNDGQIIEDCTQKSIHSFSDLEYECAEETEVLNQLRPLRLHLKLAKAGYKVISSHNL
jgi:hypothetical protein